MSQMCSLYCCCEPTGRFSPEDLQCYGALCQGVNLFSTTVEHHLPLVARTLNCRVVYPGGLDDDLFCSVTARLAKLCSPFSFQQTDDDTCISTLVTVDADNLSSSHYIDKRFNKNCGISVNSFFLTSLTLIFLFISV